MLCPNCSQQMDYVTADNQAVLHCGNCGGSFFSENAINRVSITSAEKLAADKKTDEISGKNKLCPKDGSALTSIQNPETVPQDVTLLRCPSCRGIFVFPDDLVKFKQAQVVKIKFFKLWHKPLPSLQAVLVLSFVGIISLVVISRFNTFINQFSYRASASDLIKKIYISKSGRYLFLSFKTKTPFKSEIIFDDKTTGIKIKKIISQEPTTFHYLTTGDVNSEDEIFYQIILTDEKGKEIKTERKKLIFF